MPVQDQEDQQGRVGPFVTYIERVRPDGAVARWESRRHRKHLKAGPAAGSTWWAPGARGWWIAVLFAVGSLLFALGAVPGYASAVGASWDAVTFFSGSLFFTGAGFLTYREAADAGPRTPGALRRRFFVLAAPPHALRQPNKRDGREIAFGTMRQPAHTGVDESPPRPECRSSPRCR